MTKINPITDSPGIHDQKKINKPATGGFESSLRTAFTERTTGGLFNSQVSRLGEVRAASAPQTSSLADGIASETDRLLALLETYATDLENPNKTLRDLAPMAAQIKEAAGLVMAAAQRQATPDDELNRIATNAAFTANIEYVKFQRGDYI
ncbi:MAG: hypothetical protein JRH15_14030 [Deltaproteobacteria bacterium]|nr:hypothetical protein [Deltaproteobacteria bacterium]